MGKFILLLFICISSCKAAIDINHFKAWLIQWEGYHTEVYKDPGSGHRIIGIGHNLDTGTPWYKKLIGLDYTKNEIDQFFIADLNVALAAARKGIQNFDNLPRDAQYVTLSLIWSCGPSGFMKFKDFRNSLKRRHFVLASTALRDSLWFKQVQKRRAFHHYNLLKNCK